MFDAMNNKDELPLFRPKIGGKVRKEQSRVPRSPLKKLTSSARGGFVKRGSRPAHVKPSSGFSRKVIVKARVVRMNAYGKKAASLHERYLQREHVGKDGAEGHFYGASDIQRNPVFEPGSQGEAHQFRFIISPADAHELELEDFTRTLMQQVEKDLGREIHWKAVNHYNTDNPHVHVIVRGIDRQGKELRIDPDYISNGLRYRAQELVNRELGVQSQWEIDQALAKEIGRERYTSLDARLSKLEVNGRVDLGHYPETGAHRIDQGRLVSRLQELEKFGLAEREVGREWQMKSGWQQSLTEMGERAQIYREIHHEVGGDPSRYRIFDSKVHGEGIVGRLATKGLADELGDRYFCIVETAQGTAFYVPLDKSSNPDEFRKGEIVSIQREQEKWLKPTDHFIAEQAARNNGIYDRERHLNELEEKSVVVGKGRVDKESLIEAIEKRLQRLRRFRLAEFLQDGIWRVEPSMIETLEKKDRQQPSSRLAMKRESTLSLEEQEVYHGRTWLDRFTAQERLGDAARHGFGKELTGAIQRRVELLREMGVDPMDPARAKALDQIEKRDLAHKVGTAAGATLKELAGGGKISGVMTDSGILPSGRRYAQVLDPKSREFAMVPWRAEFDRLAGKSVDLLKDRQTGRYVMRQLERGLGR